MKELLEKAVESGTIWLLLGSLVSSDNLLSREDCEKSLMMIKEIRNTMQQNDFKMDIETYNKAMKFLDDAEDIVCRDLARFMK